MKHRGPILITALIILFVAEAVRWVWLYRVGQPFDIDESGYMSQAFNDANGFREDGISGLLEAANNQARYAPGVPALAAVVYLTMWSEPVAAIAIPIATAAITLLATWLWARQVANDRVAVIAAVLVAATPAFIDYSTAFSFAVPVTCALTVALLCYSYSDILARPGWALAFGFCVGLVPLLRTLGVVFLPGVALAVGLQIVTARD